LDPKVFHIFDASLQKSPKRLTNPLEMEALYGFMGKSWEDMGIPSGKHTNSY
jgi:hypothetical protein